VGRARRRRYLPSHTAAGRRGSSSSDHHSDGGREDRDSATPACANAVGDAGAGAPGESVLEIGGPALLGVPDEVADGVVVFRLLVGDGVLDGVLAGVLVADGVLDTGLVADGIGGVDWAADVGAGFGETEEPFRVMSELPLLW
jgi:hypothetical protein